MQDDDNLFGDLGAGSDRKTEDTVFRVLEAENTRANMQSDSKPSVVDRVQSDFAADFADPSLMYHPPGEDAAPEPQHTFAESVLDAAPEPTTEMETSHASEDFEESEPESEMAFDDSYHVLEADPAGASTAAPVGTFHDLSKKPEGDKPIICLMGEFSAGKSTLSNLLLGTNALPVNVTATQLPPVWISKGSEAPYRVGLDGEEYDIALEEIEKVAVEDTAYIRIFHDADLLDSCDLIDMPGISDPNMDAEVWQRVIHFADAVIWCSHATQAWRQSEAAVWSMLPTELYAQSLLLLTRMDKILSDRDQMRVIKRVGRETNGLFRELFPISLTRALAAVENPEKWALSGAQDFMGGLSALIEEIAARKAGEAPSQVADVPAEPARIVMPSRVRPKPLGASRANSRTRSKPAPLPPL